MLKGIQARARTTYRRYDRVVTQTRELARKITDFGRFNRRVAAGRQLAQHAGPNIPKDRGFLRFEGRAFHTASLVDAGRQIFARYQHETANLPVANKEYFRNILRDEDLAAYPAVLDLAFDHTLLGSLSRYFGFLPELCSVGLMLSRPSEQRIGSQHGHFDAKDSNHVKVIVAVEDVLPENGPFEFLPADTSMRVREKWGLEYGFGRRFRDEDLFDVVPRDRLISMTARAGDGIVVDTSNCLHFGSRVERGFRLLWFIHFSTFADYQRMEMTGNGAILLANRDDRSSFARDDVSRLVLRAP